MGILHHLEKCTLISVHLRILPMNNVGDVVIYFTIQRCNHFDGLRKATKNMMQAR